jgi:hypothetical protein
MLGRSPLPAGWPPAFSGDVSSYWLPAYGHPDGLSSTAWFRIDDERGYRAAGHPEGESDKPCLRLVDGEAYPTFSPLPSDGPCFEVIGSFVYPVGVNTPWFVIRRDQLCGS